MQGREITFSVVSHGQGNLVVELLKDLDETGAGLSLAEVLVTCNLPEDYEFKLRSAPLKVIVNSQPKGFGENHNAAFKQCLTEFFCVANPDIRLNANPFPALLQRIISDQTGVVGPRVKNLQDELEDSARPFPNMLSLLKKLVGKKDVSSYSPSAIPDFPDWVAGMFMFFNAKAFAEIGGFDERYFLYYEDVDVCARLHSSGWRIGYCRDAEVIHDARRDSHRKLRYLLWHLSSMLRFFFSSAYRVIKNK